MSLRVSRKLIWQRRTSCCTFDNRDISSIITTAASASAVFILVSILCKNALFKWKSHIKYVAESNSVHVYLTRDSWRSRATFITPASTSPTTRQTICTPTSDQLSLEDAWSNRKSSTLLSDLTVPVPPRGEQLFTQEHCATLKWLHFEMHSLLLDSPSSVCIIITVEMRIVLFHTISFLFFSSQSQRSGSCRGSSCVVQHRQQNPLTCIYSLIFLFLHNICFKAGICNRDNYIS